MKRLRLRRVWVFFAILLCVMGFVKLQGINPKVEAVGTETETTEKDVETGQYKIWFLTEGGAGDTFVDPDGNSQVQWDMVTSGSSGFNKPNTGTVKAMISISGDAPSDMTGIVDTLEWNFYINGNEQAGNVENEIISIIDKGKDDWENGIQVSKGLLLDVKAAGLISIKFEVIGKRNGSDEKVINLNRTIIIGSELQIYDKYGTTAHKYAFLKKDDVKEAYDKGQTEQIVTIYANNADIDTCRIYWFYMDAAGEYHAVSPANIEVIDPGQPNKKKGLPGSSKIVTDVTDGTGSFDSGGMKVYPYDIKVGGTGGFTRLVGRIYLNGDSTANEFIETTFDFIESAWIKTKNLELDADGVLTLSYGDTEPYNILANDNGTLGWTSYKDYLNVTEHGTPEDQVIQIGKSYITAQNYGLVTLEAAALYSDWENFAHVANDVTDTLKIKVKADILKGTSSKTIIDYNAEVITVGGSIQLTTNVVGSEYQYTWYYDDGTGPQIITPNTKSDYFSMETVQSTSGYSTIILKGKKSGQVKMYCTVMNGTETILDKKQFVIKIVDTMTLSETKKSIPVGGSFGIEAYISGGTMGNAVTWSVAEGYEDYISIESTGRTTAVVTGLASTNNKPILCTATYELNGATVSATFYVTVVPAITGAYIEADPSATISVGGSTNLNLILDSDGTSFTSDQIKWVLKNVNGVEASTIISKTDSESDILQTTIKGLSAGEAYVAAVTNDEAQTEIAIITIKVVSEVTGILLNEHEVTGYLPGSFELVATPQPVGYNDAENLIIEWSSSNENIATVTPSEDSSLRATVTYVGVGTVRITASIAGSPALADICTFIVENPVTQITLDPTQLRMRIGESRAITAKLQPDTATTTEITWKIEDENIATVSKDGVVTAVAAGSTVLTATTSNGLTAQCVVTVLVPVESIELNYSSITVKKGTVFFLTANVLPIEAFDRTITWSSENPEICTVEQDGSVTANTTGVCVITATSNENPEITASCTVTVTESVTGITLNYKEKTIKPQETFILTATVLPSDALNRNVTFTSSNPDVATVDENGLVTGVAGGKTIIVVTTEDRGLIASCTVIVQQDISDIKFSITEMNLAKGDNKKINYTLTPSDATIRDLTWTSKDPSIAIVDAEGYVHGVSLGETIITATSKDGTKISATCKVTVIEPVTKIVLSENSVIMTQGDEHTLTYTIVPETATIKDVVWSSSNVAVATVNSLGIIKAVGEGETKIRVAATDDSEIYAECIVVVEPYIAITSIRLNTTETTMVVGDKRTLTDRSYPNNTTERAEWRSSDTSIATVDENGNVNAVGPGTCTISKLGVTSGVEGTCKVHVLGLTATEITLEKYDTYDLYLDDTANTITWFSRDKRTATVSRSGLVTARRAGTTYIVADLNGKLVSCKVTVVDLKK